ncbi:MAG: GntR family transcriptional regulator [Gammaproteobacteria bacterium]|nr:GntR family transcriptional regulator [Gammaproteobacteria bacterium]
MKRLDSSTVGSNTYETIKKDILFGGLKPGEKLKLEALKQKYAASVSTLRETLNRLASEGFVVAAEQRGFFVSPISKKDLMEIADMRVLLESNALKASIEAGDTEWEANVVAAYHKLKMMEERLQAGDHSEIEVWKRYDWEFHHALIAACESSTLKLLHSIIFDKYLRYQVLTLGYRGKAACDEHKQMMEAALARDTGKAIAVLEQHVTKCLDSLVIEFAV